MAVTALIKFTQGFLNPPAGRALVGAPSVLVNIANDDPTDILSWKVELVYVPPGSTVSMGLLASGNSNTPAASFIPDLVPGCYRIKLTVYDTAGLTGASNIDIRNFAVADANGFIFPPYQQLPQKLPVLGSGLPQEKPDECNFGGQPYGWDGIGTEGLVLDFMRTVSTNLGNNINFSYFDIPNPSITVPSGQEMFVDQVITGPGLLIVNGLVKSPTGRPYNYSFLSPPAITSDVSDYNPAGLSSVDVVRLSSNAPWTVRGLNPAVQVKTKKLVNTGNFALTLPHQDGLTSPGSRFETPGGLPVTLIPGASREAFVDPSIGRWRVAG